MNTRKNKLDKDLTVVMSKKLAESRYSMSLTERRLLFIAMSKIHPDDMEFGVLEFSVSEYSALLTDSGVGVGRGGQLYQDIKDGCKSLLARLVEINQGKGWRGFQWMSEAEIDGDTGKVKLKFHENMRPFLLYMLENKGYTKFMLRYALPLTSMYAIKFFELFHKEVWETHPTHRLTMTIEEIKEVMMLPEGKYERVVDLRRYVIDQATKEINQKTDLMVSVRYKKGARNKFLSATFTIKLKADMTTDWNALAKWDEADLAEAIEEKLEKYKGQKVSIPIKNPSNPIYREALAKFLWELREGTHDLSKIKNMQAWATFRINAIKDELDLNQTSIDELLSKNKVSKL